jgi:hypothetical protein
MEYPEIKYNVFCNDYRIDPTLQEDSVKNQLAIAKREVDRTLSKWVDNVPSFSDTIELEYITAVYSLAKGRVELLFSTDKELVEEELDSKIRLIYASEAEEAIKRLTKGQVRADFTSKLSKILAVNNLNNSIKVGLI